MMVKSILFLAGAMFIVLGAIGVLTPDIAASYYNMDLSVNPSRTSFRAISGMSVGVGLLFLFYSTAAKELLFSLLVLLACFVLARGYGLLIDGFNQPKMQAELAFEIVSFFLLLIVYKKVFSEI